jgi:hypothetical protein
MVPLTELLLPILLSAVFVFIASSIIHMAPLWHRKDYPAPTNQEQILDALRPLAIPPGDYMLPRAANMAEMKTPEFQEKMNRGPVVIMTVVEPPAFNMGRSLGLWFLYSVIIATFAAYVTGRAVGRGTEYLEVFRFVGATTFIAYALGLYQMSIWYRRSWRMTFIGTLDGLIYALLTAGVFGWLWPR